MSVRDALGRLASVVALLLLATAVYRVVMPAVEDRLIAAVLSGVLFIMLAPLLLPHGRPLRQRPHDGHEGHRG